MYKQLTFLLLISVSLLRCNEPVKVIEPPTPPRHDVQIDGDVRFQGEISWSAKDNSIDTQIWAENTGTDSARIETGPCAIKIIALNNDFKPIWYNRPKENSVCFDELLVFKFATNDTVALPHQSYISGDQWYYDIPAGDLLFVASFQTDKGVVQSFKLSPINESQ